MNKSDLLFNKLTSSINKINEIDKLKEEREKAGQDQTLDDQPADQLVEDRPIIEKSVENVDADIVPALKVETTEKIPANGSAQGANAGQFSHVKIVEETKSRRLQSLVQPTLVSIMDEIVKEDKEMGGDLSRNELVNTLLKTALKMLYPDKIQ